MATLFPLPGFPTSAKQCALIPSGDYPPSLRSPWRAAVVGWFARQLSRFLPRQHVDTGLHWVASVGQLFVPGARFQRVLRAADRLGRMVWTTSILLIITITVAGMTTGLLKKHQRSDPPPIVKKSGPNGEKTPVPNDPGAGQVQSTRLVRQIQGELKRLGCYKGSIDGIFGSRSRAALKQCARDAKLGSVAVDTQTLRALTQLVQIRTAPVQNNIAYDSRCMVTIRHSLVDLKREPGFLSTDQGKVPPGTYPVIDHKWVWHVTDQLFYKLQIGNQSGWIRASNWEIEDRTGNCP